MSSFLDKKSTGKPRTYLQVILDAVFLIAAACLGFYTGKSGIDIVVPSLLVLGTIWALRQSFTQPYYKTFTFYMAIAAFSYYYFYCSALMGRNPTTVDWITGRPAEFIEQIQKDAVFLLVVLLGCLKLIQAKLENQILIFKRLNHPLIRCLLCLFLFCVIRACIVLMEGESIFFTLSYLRHNLEIAVIPLLFCTSLIRNEKELRALFKGCFYTIGIVSVLGIVEFLIEGSIFVKIYGGQEIHRAASTLQNPNNLGCYLGTTLGVFILYFYRNQLRMWERNLFWLTMPLGFTCLFMTMSRSSILVFFLSMTIIFILLFLSFERERGKNRVEVCRNLMIAYLMALSISVFVLYKFFNFNDAMDQAADTYLIDSSSIAGYRIFALSGIFTELLSNPWGLLIGYSTLGFSSSPDNALAALLLRNGIIGFMMYGYIWFGSLKIAWDRIMDKKVAHSFLYMVCFYVLLYQFFFGFSSRLHDTFPHNVYFWVAVGILAWLESRTNERIGNVDLHEPPEKMIQ